MEYFEGFVAEVKNQKHHIIFCIRLKLPKFRMIYENIDS